MFRTVFLFVILGLGLFVGTQYSGQQGYVLISIANKTIEMSVTTLVIFIIATLAALFFLEFILKRAASMSYNTWNWFSVRKLRRSRRYTNEGIIKLLEGDFKHAEKKVMRWANHHDKPLLCYLIAAEAAFSQGDENKRQQYLEKASEQDDSTLAVGLTRAKQDIRAKNYELAFDGLSTLNGQFPNNSLIQDLLKGVYIELKLWQPLIDILPKLGREKSINKEESDRYLLLAHSGLLEEIAQQKGSEGLIAHWDSLPKKLKNEPSLIATFSKQLIARKADYEAFGVVKNVLKKNNVEELYALLPEMNLSDRHPMNQFLLSSIKKDPDNAAAHSALGQLYIRDQNWPEAQKHLEQALAKRSNVSDYAYLADALEHQNLNQAARDVSRKALTLVKS
ncbi:heme biosynthesis protein HemY [Vibrio agarivorans]|uniref:Heme biosynthesis HemY N-terminal domain-containing protein n=1 Tax=Vibrio agarivorans TaxID=153622 RepID=A0ABT7Y312_9VIBR|nr:heme biosynthesis HemY N-terminal domain-containing protein [Vibrio agarivorans]MDN2482360.1 heme biosynthesis HemY N-terminal domain-containing protein [Vibrio agarivorans]